MPSPHAIRHAWHNKALEVTKDELRSPLNLIADVLHERMKKAATYYFCVEVLLHIFVGWILMQLFAFIQQLYPLRFLSGNMNLPPLTEFMLAIYAWPFVIAALAAAGLVASVILEDKRRLLPHVAFFLQCASCIMLLATATAYLAPFSHMDFVRDIVNQHPSNIEEVQNKGIQATPQ